MNTRTTTVFRRGFAAFAVLSATACLALAAGTFEGRIDMKMTTPSDEGGTQRLMHYTIKGEKMRLDFEGNAESRKQRMNAAGMIVDFEKRETITLIDSQDANGAPRKMAMRHPMSDPKKQSANNTKAASHSGNAPVATGKTETIAGYPAAEYKVKDEDGGMMELWLAKGLGNFMSPSMMNSRNDEPSPEWEKIIREGGLFPLRTIARDADGTEVSRTEVTKIDKSPVPESVFSTEGYTEMQMPAFGKRGGSLGDKLKALNPSGR